MGSMIPTTSFWKPRDRWSLRWIFGDCGIDNIRDQFFGDSGQWSSRTFLVIIESLIVSLFGLARYRDWNDDLIATVWDCDHLFFYFNVLVSLCSQVDSNMIIFLCSFTKVFNWFSHGPRSNWLSHFFLVWNRYLFFLTVAHFLGWNIVHYNPTRDNWSLPDCDHLSEWVKVKTTHVARFIGKPKIKLEKGPQRLLVLLDGFKLRVEDFAKPTNMNMLL